jgi:hypothetical protein
MNDQTGCESDQQEIPRLLRASSCKFQSMHERAGCILRHCMAASAAPSLSTRPALYEPALTSRCKARNPERPKRLNIPPHRRMVARSKPRRFSSGGALFCASELRFVRASFDLKDELHIAAHLQRKFNGRNQSYHCAFDLCRSNGARGDNQGPSP